MARTGNEQWVSRWWLVFLHGILLIWLSYFMICRVEISLGQLGRMTAFLALLTGAIAILGSGQANRPDRSPFDLWWGRIATGAGVALLARQDAQESWIHGFMSMYMILHALRFFMVRLQLTPQPRFWGYGQLFLLLTLVVVWWSWAGVALPGVGPMLIPGFQCFLNGFLLVYSALGIRRIQWEFNFKLVELRDRHREPHLQP